jgi:hypothetical protein
MDGHQPSIIDQKSTIVWRYQQWFLTKSKIDRCAFARDNEQQLAGDQPLPRNTFKTPSKNTFGGGTCDQDQKNRWRKRWKKITPVDAGGTGGRSRVPFFPVFFFPLVLFNSTINFFPPVHRPPDATSSTYRWKCSTAPPCSTPFESIPFGRKIGLRRGPWSQDCSSTGQDILPPVRGILESRHSPPVREQFALILCSTLPTWYNKRVGDPTNNNKGEIK